MRRLRPRMNSSAQERRRSLTSCRSGEMRHGELPGLNGSRTPPDPKDGKHRPGPRRGRETGRPRKAAPSLPHSCADRASARRPIVNCGILALHPRLGAAHGRGRVQGGGLGRGLGGGLDDLRGAVAEGLEVREGGLTGRQGRVTHLTAVIGPLAAPPTRPLSLDRSPGPFSPLPHPPLLIHHLFCRSCRRWFGSACSGSLSDEISSV